jgi:CRP-like cAMP-binding protein
MARHTQRILIKILDPGWATGAGAGDLIYVEDGNVLKDSPAPLSAEVIAAAWPLIRDRAIAFAAGDSAPAEGATASGIRFVVQPAPQDTAINVTRRFERSVTHAAHEISDRGPFLSRLPASLVQALTRASEVRQYAHGETVIQQGAEGRHLFLIAEGEVEVVRTGDQEEAVMAILSRGECFGEMSVLTGDPVSATVRARTVARILALSRERLDEMLIAQPILAREFSRLLADRIKRTSESVEAEMGRSIFGSLSMIGVADLVQTMHGSRRTGRLTLTHGQENGDLYFSSGALMGAQRGLLLGNDALFAMLRWREGRFAFEQGAFDAIGPIRGDVIQLLMEGLRLMDEEARKSAADSPGE